MNQCTDLELRAELRDIEPTPDGWRQRTLTGASLACSCGAKAYGSPSEMQALALPHMRGV